MPSAKTSGSSTKNVGRGQKGPAGEVHSGQAKVDKTIAGRKNNKVKKGSTKKVRGPGVVRG